MANELLEVFLIQINVYESGIKKYIEEMVGIMGVWIDGCSPNVGWW